MAADQAEPQIEQTSNVLQLDCRKLSCPMPIVELSKKVRTLSNGDRLEVLATDLAFKLDLEAWLRRTGHQLMDFHVDDYQHALIQIVKP